MASSMNVIVRNPNSALNAICTRIDATLVTNTGDQIGYSNRGHSPSSFRRYSQKQERHYKPGDEIDTECVVELASSAAGRVVCGKDTTARDIDQRKRQPETTIRRERLKKKQE